MPCGEHRVRCLHCGHHYTCGDAITFTCLECEALGHRDGLFDCPICGRESDERRARIDAAQKAAGVIDALP